MTIKRVTSCSLPVTRQCYKDQQRYKKYIYVHRIQYTWLKQDPYFSQIRETWNIKERDSAVPSIRMHKNVDLCWLPFPISIRSTEICCKSVLFPKYMAAMAIKGMCKYCCRDVQCDSNTYSQPPFLNHTNKLQFLNLNVISPIPT